MLSYIPMSTPDKDKSIIDGCVKGRPQAWNEFIQRFSGLVMWSVRERLSKFGFHFTNDDLEDIHQEVFLSIYKENKLSRLKDPSKIAAWLAILSGNIAVNKIGRIKGGILSKESVSLFEEIQNTEDSALTISDILKDESASILEKIDQKEQQELVVKIIDSLAPRDKIVLNLYYIHGNTINEMAQCLNMPQGTVASIIARAKEKIKQKLKDKNFYA